MWNILCSDVLRQDLEVVLMTNLFHKCLSSKGRKKKLMWPDMTGQVQYRTPGIFSSDPCMCKSHRSHWYTHTYSSTKRPHREQDTNMDFNRTGHLKIVDASVSNPFGYRLCVCVGCVVPLMDSSIPHLRAQIMYLNLLGLSYM